MQKIITETDLRVAILELESKQAEEARLMKTQFLVTVESIKPVNLIKSTLMEAVQSDDLQNNILNSTIGISAGYISKALFQGISGSPAKKILGTMLMFGIKNLVAHNPELVKSIGSGFFRMVRKTIGDKNKDANSNEIS
jgi:hypothetical protein